jgi:hypothetical protein
MALAATVKMIDPGVLFSGHLIVRFGGHDGGSPITSGSHPCRQRQSGRSSAPRKKPEEHAMSDTAILPGWSPNPSAPLTDTPIFHALAAAATPIFHAMTIAGEAIHRPPATPAAGPPTRHRRPQPEAKGGLHHDSPTLPLPIQTRPQPYPPTRPARPVSWAYGTTDGLRSPRGRSPLADQTLDEHPYRTGRHRLISPCSV